MYIGKERNISGSVSVVGIVRAFYSVFDAQQIKSSYDSIIFQYVSFVHSADFSKSVKQVNWISSLIAYMYRKVRDNL